MNRPTCLIAALAVLAAVHASPSYAADVSGRPLWDPESELEYLTPNRPEGRSITGVARTERSFELFSARWKEILETKLGLRVTRAARERSGNFRIDYSEGGKVVRGFLATTDDLGPRAERTIEPIGRALLARGVQPLRSYKVGNGNVLYFATDAGTPEGREIQVRLLKDTNESDARYVQENSKGQINVVATLSVPQRGGKAEPRTVYVGPNAVRDTLCNYKTEAEAQADLARLRNVYVNSPIFKWELIGDVRMLFISRPEYPDNQWCAITYHWGR
ncbi:MAG: hypothetical protein HY059_09270 [Proteobacteria bacterium]|nr:hypothetical protein [Pseudomonadota bacterium]